MKTFEALAHELATSPEFRIRFAEDPDAALESLNLTVSKAERELISEVNALLAQPGARLRHLLAPPGPDGPWNWWLAAPAPTIA